MKRIDRRSGSRVGVGSWLVILALVGLSSSLQAEVVFHDPDGEPLPFKTFEEVENFLETADIVWKEAQDHAGEGWCAGSRDPPHRL